MLRTVFISGTDTHAGKTLLTGLLLRRLQQRHQTARAIKPFCSGSRDDATFLASLHQPEPQLDEINPFFYPAAVAPGVAARRVGNSVSLPECLRYLDHMQQSTETLLIEGAGGLCVPLGERFSVLDLIREMRCATVVAARNRLGVINHARLTMDRLAAEGVTPIALVVMGAVRTDASTETNASILQECLPRVPIVSLPELPAPSTPTPTQVQTWATSLAQPLDDILRAVQVPEPKCHPSSL